MNEARLSSTLAAQLDIEIASGVRKRLYKTALPMKTWRSSATVPKTADLTMIRNLIARKTRNVAPFFSAIPVHLPKPSQVIIAQTGGKD